VRALILLLELGCVAALWVAVRRLAPPRARTPLVFAIKAYLTLRVIWLIALHEVDGMTIYAVLREQLRDLDAATFALYVLLAMGLKLVGIAASIGRWMLMLRGQDIELPVRHVVGAFFIGRFLGTFLPSTLGLDGYKLYDAARFSGRTIEVTAATAVEKVLGVSGIFGTFLIALPLGVGIFGSYAGVITWLGVPIALLPLVFVSLGFFWPGPVLIRFALGKLPLPTLRRTLERIADGASAYARHKGLLLAAWGLSLVQHFATASMYYATARALGVTPQSAGFWEVTFASSIQIFATVISPFTIAGEGIREAAQGLLLQGQMTFAVAAASGLLGFLAAEAPTLLGAVPWLLRRESYQPAFCRVDGRQVDYEEARRRAAEVGGQRRRAAARAPTGRGCAPGLRGRPLRGTRHRNRRGVLPALPRQGRGGGAGPVGGSARLRGADRGRGRRRRSGPRRPPTAARLPRALGACPGQRRWIRALRAGGGALLRLPRLLRRAHAAVAADRGARRWLRTARPGTARHRAAQHADPSGAPVPPASGAAARAALRGGGGRPRSGLHSRAPPS
jgi:uncharacterized membrane protein YbhN (UPF0104 family)